MLRRDSIKMCRVQGVQQKDFKSHLKVSIRVGDQIFGMLIITYLRVSPCHFIGQHSFFIFNAQ